jgi:hypothetical protein
LGLIQGENEADRRAFARLALGGDIAFMSENRLPNDGEPEPRAS